METKQERFAILNGKSGSKNQAENLILRTYLEGNGIPCKVTDFPGHAKEIARERSDVHEIIVVGGDGTLHEVLSSLRLPLPKIRLVPAGTGNSLARDLGLGSWRMSLEKLIWGKELTIDLMSLEIKTKEESFSCVSASTVCFGFPAKVTQMANRSFKRFRKFCYPIAAALGSFVNTRDSYLISYDRFPAEKKSLSGGIINNSRHVANFVAFPDAELSDGKFDVAELDAGSIKQSIHNLSILSKTYFYDPPNRLKAISSSVKYGHPGLLMVDGEVYEDVMEFSVKILPGALRIHSLG
ncbi:hypothetical protein JWG45_01640 [Leptospira sp. 201903070]|jgi:diacylglycerol kinase (ATP)|uniref:DAGKc domain-containing protein n=1 Tax=Leptospira ainlahdjerensis TaxID=2810033 RepID=A0ABS2U6T3_9LEPT|nr:diacylglycerol kinase family protein [Leptospira ainlahdjerensis]MBM9575844.1 hypothetical protein [Leptospira ainlahdjerensis]